MCFSCKGSIWLCRIPFWSGFNLVQALREKKTAVTNAKPFLFQVSSQPGKKMNKNCNRKF